MKTALLSLLCVFVWSQHTEGLTDQQVTLGQRVTLACEFRLKAVVWFVIKPSSARPVMILRTFDSEEAVYYDESLRSKYSEGRRSHLIINDVTVDDLGTYYCIKAGWALKISDGTRLDTTEMSQQDIACTKLDTTGPNKPEQKNPQDQSSNQIMIVTITLLMVVLFAAVISLLMVNRKLSKKIPKYVNGHQILNRRITSIQTNGTAGHNSHNSLTDHVYLDVLPYSA